MSHTVKLSECCETCTGQREGMQRLLIKAVEELDKRYSNDARGVVYQAASDLLERWTQPRVSAGPRERARALGRRNAYEYALAKWLPQRRGQKTPRNEGSHRIGDGE